LTDFKKLFIFDLRYPKEVNMTNTAKNYLVQENKVQAPEIQTIEDRISNTLEFIYYDAKKETSRYLEDTKVEAGGE